MCTAASTRVLAPIEARSIEPHMRNPRVCAVSGLRRRLSLARERHKWPAAVAFDFSHLCRADGQLRSTPLIATEANKQFWVLTRDWGHASETNMKQLENDKKEAHRRNHAPCTLSEDQQSPGMSF